ncbi:peroxide stress-activated histidine kinase mak2 [Plectosphaerella cucumerina]|uniref:histidine kinase n=1 Tax=Plectosphaerella cucumerina TaxID=40658 RepID=A0A8K0TKC7_9PEZI|nr:peroxide stress-activated histidine kinase mak2 [Plectosphaerella cucumerina]
MDSGLSSLDDQYDPPQRLLERLRQIAGYTWDDGQSPFHTTYDTWHATGTRFVSPYSQPSPTPLFASSPGSAAARLQSGRPSPSEYPSSSSILTGGPLLSDPGSDFSPSAASPPIPTSAADTQYIEEPVVARISYHILREERTFHITKNLVTSVDPNGEHIVKPLELVRLPPAPGDLGQIIVAIYQHPGRNILFDWIDLGPAFFRTRWVDDRFEAYRKEDFNLEPPITLAQFLDFAIGAAQCLEILHYGQGATHGELRPDAFHYNLDTKRVKLFALGTGTRSFENRLQSSAWSNLSKELGAKNKLLYISPEQTGRMPAEPDSRTDIYSLGVIFWTLLARQPIFDGDSPLDIVHSVLKGSIPRLSKVRPDVPPVLDRIIDKCTAMRVGDRYHSASGLRHDLVKVQRFLNDEDWLALEKWTIGEKDVSSFFILPTMMIGRQRERNELLKVIDRVAKSHLMSQKSSNRISEGSTLSNELLDNADVSSEGASSAEGTTRRSGSFTQGTSSDLRPIRASFVPSVLSDSQTVSGETTTSANSGPLNRMARPWERNQSVSVETRSLVDSLGGGSEGNRHSVAESTSSSLSRQLGSARFRRRGHCEVVTIEGVAGLGKSFLYQSVFTEARKRGYYVSAKFDNARRQAFGPLLKLLSSLFKQVFGEKRTDTPFHHALKQYIRPVWPMLAKVLGLPDHLLGSIETNSAAVLSRSPSIMQARHVRPGSAKPTSPSPEGSPGLLPKSGAAASSKTSQDFLRAGTSTKNTRLMNIFLDVLRMFTAHKFVCFVLDDLHFADSESLELITQIICARMKMVVIMTYRPDELSLERVQSIINPPDSDEFTSSGGPSVTRIPLSPLSENDIVQYVATTLCRPKDDIVPLALVIQSKTAGNPFYIREMLSACYRNKNIWYDYRDSNWHYDLDRLFDQFKTEGYDVLDTDFITQRLGELPPASRAILAWASLLGYSFSFELVSRLMSGEFQYSELGCVNAAVTEVNTAYSPDTIVAGLQAAVTACIIVPGETDDRFRFAHDRYIQAASNLKECNARKMQFIIAQTLLKYYPNDPRARDTAAFHVCASVDIIKERVEKREPFRRLLFECAATATENGARPTAAKCYSTAVDLLQPNPWDDGVSDASYDETMQLYLRAAECNLYIDQNTEAQRLLSLVFRSARTPLDMAPAYVLKSRIAAQSGDALAAVESLEECLATLKIKLDQNPTFEKCDAEFERLAVKLQTMSRSQLMDPTDVQDASLASVGAVLAETVSSAWWSDSLRFYNLALATLNLHLTCGSFPQSGLAFMYFGVIALSRFNMVDLAVEVGDICIELLDKFRDPFSMARGYMVYANFIGHVHYPISVTLAHLEGSVEYAAASGDRISSILSAGLAALLKFYASENCADLEAYCQYSCEDILSWKDDTRGGPLLISVRQVCRAMQGKTKTKDALHVLTDEKFNVNTYKTWLASKSHTGDRATLFFETLEVVPLFLYGHYDRAVELGELCYKEAGHLWSARNSRLLMFFYGLALAGRMLRKLDDPRLNPTDLEGERQSTISRLEELSKKIKEWEAVNNVNYASWSKMLDAQALELGKDYGGSIRMYEEALDHAEEHNQTFDQALGHYLMAGVFVGRRARRSARAAMKDAVALYRQFGAVGVADHVEEEHTLLLHGPTRNPRVVDATTQTDFAPDVVPPSFRPLDADEAEDTGGAGANHSVVDQRIGAWRGSVNLQAEAGAGLPALDMIDLHAILLSSQVISAVLNVDQLLETMCDVILQTCGGTATLAAIVVRDSQGWHLGASGDAERGAKAPLSRQSISTTPMVAENVILYCTRFRETLFIPDILSDERFGNVGEGWLARNILSKAIIAIPIARGPTEDGLLGVLYLEGEPGSFTDRNVSVLQLLVNQIGISYSNSLAMKDVEKVSKENERNVSELKRTVVLAREAEAKARTAETEAKRNVKLAEEAARAKSIFLANVSHELRTPLNGVIGNSELLRDSGLNKEQLEMADSIRVSADLLLTVINDILDFSRMEADKMKLYVIAFNPEEMVREVVRAVSYSNRQRTKRKNVVIIQDIDLPSMLIYGDPIRLHQVLGNLINNSLKFTENGAVTIGARVESQTAEKAVLTFRVQDTGIGIPPDQLKKLFQPFSQADASTARKYGGSGLGLSICKSLIETMMKGQIRLESQEGVGTTAIFSVTFDKATSDVNAGDVQAVKSPPPMDRFTIPTAVPAEQSLFPYLQLTQIPKDQIRICIAEDNLINQTIAMKFSRRLGYTIVDAYENGMKAVEGLRQKAQEGRPYHIVLMDVQMPVLDGYEATKLIRREPVDAIRKVLIIAMTASAIQGDREKCLAAGMNDYIAKPVRVDVLEKKLDNYTTTHAPISATPPARPLAARPSAARPLIPTPAPTPDSSSARTTPSPATLPSTDANGAGLNIAVPIRDDPSYSRPTMTQSAPSQRSSETRLSDNSSAVDVASLTSQRRQPRKLTKSRANSDNTQSQAGASVPSPSPAPSSAPAPAPSVTEKPKGVLTKRQPQRQSTMASADAENLPYDNTGRNSIGSQGSTSRDRLFQG